MTKKKRDIGNEIIADLKQFNASVRDGVVVREKYTVRSACIVPDPSVYSPADIRAARQMVGVSQPIFARVLGVSAALVRSWECGQRKPSPLARRMLDLIRANPSNWRGLIRAA